MKMSAGTDKYRIELQKDVVKNDIPALPKTMRKSIKTAIEERLMLDSIGFGKPLQYSLKGYRRLRVGDYRIVYRIEADEKVVYIVAIKHRKDVYE